MDQEKRKIIVKEIEHWRSSRLLPEQYCDFLLNLYTEQKPANRSFSSFAATAVKQGNWIYWLFAFAIISLFYIVVLHFNAFHPGLQILTSTIFVALCYGAGAIARRKSQVFALLAIGAGSIFMLFIGIYLLRLHAIDGNHWIVLHVALCSIVWIVAGYLLRFGMLHFCGWCGLVLLYAGFLSQTLPNASGLELQLYWLPASVAFLWLSWLLRGRNKTVGAVFFLVGALLWFMPEVGQMIFYDATVALLQWALFAKMGLAAVALFILRKKWIEWVL